MVTIEQKDLLKGKGLEVVEETARYVCVHGRRTGLALSLVEEVESILNADLTTVANANIIFRKRV